MGHEEEHLERRSRVKSATVNPFEAFKFWASKPLDIALSYLDKYAKGKAVLLDPFAGSGVFVYAALLKGMKAIYNDLCPYALFLARNVMRPTDLRLIQEALCQVLQRPLSNDIFYDDGTVAIPHQKPSGEAMTIEEAIQWLYQTKCDHIDQTGKICGGDVIAEYFVWDTDYYAMRTKADDYADEKSRNGDRRYRIFLDVVCAKSDLELQGKTVEAYTFSRKNVNEKWQQVFDEDPKLWLQKYKRGKREPAVVNQIAGALIRQVFERHRRLPQAKKIKCPAHGELLQPISDQDLLRVNAIERLQYPWPDLIPQAALMYPDLKCPKTFLEIRPEQIFVRERLSTMNKAEFDDRIPMLKHFFTKRNLLALSALVWSIKQVQNIELREQLYLIFVSNLHMTAKFDRMGNFGRWGTNRYITHDDFKENNVLDQLLKGWLDVRVAKGAIGWQLNSTLEQYTFDETWDAREFLMSLNQPRINNVLFLRRDARDLGSVIGRKVVDVVFTDPPYRGEVECIQYFELSTVYTGWLSLDEALLARYGDFQWWQNEITENEKQDKDMSSYYKLLGESFLSTDAITKQGAIWLLTYHSPSKEVWEGVRHVLFESTGLRPPTYEQVVTHKIRAKGIGSFNVTRFGSVGEDAYIVLRKEEALQKTLAPKRVNEQEFLTFILRKMRKDIVRNGGITDWATFQEHYPAVVLRHGDLFDDSKSYKDFFESVTIQLAGEARIFDRDKIGEDLYRAIYGGVTAKRYLRRALEVCGQARKEISRSEMEYKILPKIDGRISNKTRTIMLKQLFDYDPIGNKYLYKGRKVRTLEKWMPKPRRRVVSAPPMPQELALKIVEAARKYGGHIVKEVHEDFHIIVEAAGRKYGVNINDEGGIRRFGAGGSEQEKRDRITVFVYHGLRHDQLTGLASLVKPSPLVAVPYGDYQKVVGAFRKYDPMEAFEHMVVKA